MIAAGRLKPGPEKSLAEDYLTRAQGLGRKCGISRLAVSEFNESQASSAAARVSGVPAPAAFLRYKEPR